MTPERRFAWHEVCRLALVTHRQLQWWDEQGILSPDLRSRKRSYSAHDAMCAMLYQEMETRGFSLRDFRQVVSEIRERHIELPDPSKRWLLTDGKRVIFLLQPDVVLAFLEQRRNPAFVLIPLQPLAARIEAFSDAPERIGPGVATSLGAREPLRA